MASCVCVIDYEGREAVHADANAWEVEDDGILNLYAPKSGAERMGVATYAAKAWAKVYWGNVVPLQDFTLDFDVAAGDVIASYSSGLKYRLAQLDADGKLQVFPDAAGRRRVAVVLDDAKAKESLRVLFGNVAPAADAK